MNKYENGKIYTIRYRLDNDLLYVGSTIQPLYKRFNEHMSKMKDEKKNNMLYLKMREINDKENWYIELYENFKCNSVEELKKREGEIQRELKSNLNIRVENRTKKEYYKDNKIYFINKSQNWYNENKERKKEYDREYRIKNREKINKYSSEYIKNNKHICECGSHFYFNGKQKHLKTKKHIDYIALLK